MSLAAFPSHSHFPNGLPDGLSLAVTICSARHSETRGSTHSLFAPARSLSHDSSRLPARPCKLSRAYSGSFNLPGELTACQADSWGWMAIYLRKSPLQRPIRCYSAFGRLNLLRLANKTHG